LGLGDEYDISETEWEDLPILDIHFSVEEDDREELEKIHPNLKSANLIKCTKFFDEHYMIEIPDIDLDLLENPEKVFKDTEIETNLNQINGASKELKRV